MHHLWLHDNKIKKRITSNQVQFGSSYFPDLKKDEINATPGLAAGGWLVFAHYRCHQIIFQREIHLHGRRSVFSWISPDIIGEQDGCFNCPDLGYMKILDAIFWRLGKMLDEEGLELTPDEFLREHAG